MNTREIENAGKIIIHKLNLDSKQSTEDLISALKKGGIAINNEITFRKLISGINARLNTFGMRIKWIPTEGKNDRWVIVVQGTKPNYVKPQVEKCLVAAIALAARDPEHKFEVQDIISTFPEDSEAGLKRAINKLLLENFLKKAHDGKLILSPRVFLEINVYHLLSSISSKISYSQDLF